MQTLEELNRDFSIPGVLSFVEGKGKLLCAEVTSEACRARVYLHGAHLTNWQPAGREPVLFLSERSSFEENKAIRGGVPVVFPWFGARGKHLTGAREDGPAHGFARTQVWDVAFAAMSGEDLHLTLTLGPTKQSCALGFDHFRVAYELVLGHTLTLRLSVANVGTSTLCVEEAFHSYFAVSDAARVSIEGLGGTEYLDKTDGFARKTQNEQLLQLVAETDRPYLNTRAAVRLNDPEAQRTIVVTKRGSNSTVIWNPWSNLTATMKDMEADGWRGMTCVETANVAEDAITLQPNEAHVMEATISVEALEQKA